MAKRQHRKSDPLKLVVIATLVLAVLSAACYLGGSYLTTMQKNALLAEQKAAEERNQALHDAYTIAVAEYEQKLADREGANEAWPAANGNGWEVVDLTNYPLENPVEQTMSRQDAMYNGMLLVNEWHSRPDDFSEDTLVGVSAYSKSLGMKLGVSSSSVKLFPAAVKALTDCLYDAKQQGYENYVIYEGYRSYEEQNVMFQSAMAKYESRYTGEALIDQAKKDCNYPGTSSYNSGMAFRIILYKSGDKTVNDKVFFACDEGLWFLNNGWKYGLVHRFPLEDYPVSGTQDKSYKTGVSAKLQTFSYVGKGNAAAMHILGLCKEEYVEYLMEHPHIAIFEDGKLRYEISREYVGEEDELTVTYVGKSSVKEATTSLDNMGYAITVFEY